LWRVRRGQRRQRRWPGPPRPGLGPPPQPGRHPGHLWRRDPVRGQHRPRLRDRPSLEPGPLRVGSGAEELSVR
jgi:hypothetical protein